MRLDIGVNAVAHSLQHDQPFRDKGDKIGLVVTSINDNYEVAEGNHHKADQTLCLNKSLKTYENPIDTENAIFLQSATNRKGD